MTSRDPHRFSTELDDAATSRLIDRLENRARDAVFARLLDQYLVRLALPARSRVLDIGCGTGAVLRTLARHSDFHGKLHGIDQCQPFVNAARGFSDEEGIGERIDYRVGDAHQLDFPSRSFDAVIAHTVISHVSEPMTVLQEMARIVRQDGTIIVFDGDYASLTFGFADHTVGQHMDTALVNATFNNPLIMRDLPRLLPELGLALVEGWGDAVTEIGNGSYFKTFAETYVPYVQAYGAVPAKTASDWMDKQLQAIADGTFFASCTYYTYLLRPIGER